MFCINCGEKLVDGSKFCPKCGTKLGEVSEEKQTKKTKQAVSSDSIPEAAKVYFEQGKKYDEKQDYKNAYAAYRSAIQIAPDFFEAHKKIAQLWIINQERDKAKKILDDVISKNPDDYEAFYLRGGVNVLLGKTDQALIDFDISLRINPDSLDTYKAIISAHKAKDDNEQIIKTANDAMKIAPNDYSLYISRGEAYYYIKSLDNALSDFNKVLEMEPDNLECLFYRGTILFEKEEYDKSLTDINHILEVSPTADDCVFMRSKIYFAKKDYKKALSDVDSYIKKMEGLYKKDCALEQYLLQAELRYKTGWYKTNPDSIMEDYLKMWNLESDDEDEFKKRRAKELGLFIDIMLDLYKKAVANYNKEKALFLVHAGSDKEQKHYDNLQIYSTVVKPMTSTSYREPNLLFLNELFADYYCKLIKLCANKQNARGYFSSHKNADSRIVPKYWLIRHAYTGAVYRRDGTSEEYGKRKWWRISDTPYSSDEKKVGGTYKYNSLEDALADYEKIIKDEYLCHTSWKLDDQSSHNKIGKNTYSETFHWNFLDNKYNEYKFYENNFMDIFIVGVT